jgi:glycosyltransferase involved in cell wall biosynthesis
MSSLVVEPPTVAPRPTEAAAPCVRPTREIVEAVLDRLPITDRVYHHLDYSKPLVVELVERIRRALSPPARVLLVGPDSLLAETLVSLGYAVDVWHFRQGHLTDEMLARVRADVTPERLAEGDFPPADEPYELVVVPLVVESVPGSPATFLRALQRLLTPSGTLLVATTNVARLDLRVMSALGRSTRSAYPSFHVSLSFPPLPRLRYYHREELLDLARQAGWRIRDSAYVTAHAACSTIDPHPPLEYALGQVAQGVMRVWPSARQAVLLELSPRLDGGDDGVGDTGYPSVSAVLAVRRGGDALREALTQLVQQDYPGDRYEVLVVLDGRRGADEQIIRAIADQANVPVRTIVADPPEGPAARNAAMRAATGAICAHTDDGCRIPNGWVRSIGAAFDETTSMLTGPVIEIRGSHPDFMVLPGTRLGWPEHELYPAFNVAYRRGVALAAGGFDESAVDGRARLPFAWDAELASRLRQLGWNGRYVKDMFLYRRYPPPARLAWIKEEWQLAAELPGVVRRMPELRPQLVTAGPFLATRTLFFDLLAIGVGVAAARRRLRWLWLGAPWLLQYVKYLDAWPPRQWRISARILAALAGRHVVWLGGLLAGSLRARRLAL